VAHQVGAYLRFLWHEATRSISTSPLNGMPVHDMVTSSINFAVTYLYTWVERITVSVECLAQERNTRPRPGLEPRPLDPEMSALTTRPLRLPNTSLFFILEIITNDLKTSFSRPSSSSGHHEICKSFVADL